MGGDGGRDVEDAVGTTAVSEEAETEGVGSAREFARPEGSENGQMAEEEESRSRFLSTSSLAEIFCVKDSSNREPMNAAFS